MDARNASLRERFEALWPDEASGHILTRWLFIRLLALIYFTAFVSLWMQIDGLVGHNGILPVADYLKVVREETGPDRYWEMPTLCWLSASDGFLHFLCGGGAVISLVAAAGLFQGPCLLIVWMFYLSLLWVCREFLGFQWDVLLLEAGFLTVFFAPWRWRSRIATDAPPSRAVLWLLRWLLFRLMFASGLVKLTSGDPLWRQLTALNVHYETQPLPTWIGWYAHQLPQWFQKCSVAGMFFIELAVPFLIFVPGAARQAACAVLIFLQLIIIATGNYCFFNLLTLALCLLLLDDARLRRLCPSKWAGKLPMLAANARSPAARRYCVCLMAVPVLALSAFVMIELVLPRTLMPSPVRAVQRAASSFCLVNHYGLFATMTTPRMEIVIEGSNDGVNWQAYEFKWKPGDLRRAPGFVAPHQPRLDWQMWFAALGSYQNNPWFVQLMVKLLQGKPEVLALVGKNPFPDDPPRYVRALFYEYHFTDFAARSQTGDWWRRELKGLYCPPLELKGGAR